MCDDLKWLFMKANQRKFAILQYMSVVMKQLQLYLCVQWVIVKPLVNTHMYYCTYSAIVEWL